MNRPEINEFDPYYATYVSLVNGGSVEEMLESQIEEIKSLFTGMPEEKGEFTYEDGKWTIKELLSHILDGERVFAYRILRISRGDRTPIEGFEQDDYIENSNANDRTFVNLLEEFEFQRLSNLKMLAGISDEASTRTGIASGKPVSVRALVFILAGHIQHHINILKGRYLGK
jgi:hypothetical protein